MPNFVNEADFTHDAHERVGVLLNNLGTPDAPTTSSVRRYLAEFLSDPRVVEVARPIWFLVLHGVILRTRPRRSAAAYQKVWGEDGSPLLVNALKQRDALRAQLGEHVVVELGMRYGNPSLAEALESLRRQNVRKLLLLPLYPQYSATTTASTFDEMSRILRTWRWLPELRTVNQYHDHDGYIDALCASVTDYRAKHGRGDKLLFSFHGIPRRYLLNGDPYHCQCHKTARLCAKKLGLGDDEWQLSFQSRLGREEWLRPYTDDVLKELAAAGLGRVDTICAGFSADCLETLEEVAIQYRELFVASGGSELHYIPALNDRADHITFLANLIEQNLQGWPRDSAADRGTAAATLERALALGAKG